MNAPTWRARAARTLLAVALVATVVACTVDRRTVTLSEDQVTSAAYQIDGLGQLTLAAGQAAVETPDGAVTVRVEPPVLTGDLDGDAMDDAAVVLVQEGPGAVRRSSLVVVLNRLGEPEPLPALALGDHVVAQGGALVDGQVRLEVLDRSAGQPPAVVDERRTVVVAVDGGHLQVVSDDVTPVGELPPPAATAPAQPVTFDGSATGSTTIEGALEADTAATYTVAAQEGQHLTAELTADLGVVLSATQGDAVLLEPGQVAADLEVPADGDVTFVVRNLRTTPSPTALEVELRSRPRPATTAPGVTPGVINLTFDDGPHPTYTPQILDILAKYRVKATFFVLGSQVQAHPDLIARIVAEGHTLANHTWDHPNLLGMSDAGFQAQVGRTQELLGANATSCLRPPYGAADATTRRQAEAMGLRLVLWTVDTNDWQLPGASTIAQRIVNGASAGGANILMHDGGGNRTQTVEGLEMALSQLQGKGLQFLPAC